MHILWTQSIPVLLPPPPLQSPSTTLSPPLPSIPPPPSPLHHTLLSTIPLPLPSLHHPLSRQLKKKKNEMYKALKTRNYVKLLITDNMKPFFNIKVLRMFMRHLWFPCLKSKELFLLNKFWTLLPGLCLRSHTTLDRIPYHQTKRELLRWRRFLVWF